MSKYICIIEDNKVCDNCCDCNTCDLDSTKTCNNCAECIDKSDYSRIEIEDIELPNRNWN